MMPAFRFKCILAALFAGAVLCAPISRYSEKTSYYSPAKHNDYPPNYDKYNGRHRSYNNDYEHSSYNNGYPKQEYSDSPYDYRNQQYRKKDGEPHPPSYPEPKRYHEPQPPRKTYSASGDYNDQGKIHDLDEMYQYMTNSEAEVIHSLFKHRKDIDRVVKQTPYGVDAWTTSKNPRISAWIIEHYYQMQQAIKEDRWFRQYSHNEHVLHAARGERGNLIWSDAYPMQDGIKVEHHGETPCSIKAVKGHADGVTAFLGYDGFTWSRQSHPGVEGCEHLGKDSWEQYLKSNQHSAPHSSYGSSPSKYGYGRKLRQLNRRKQQPEKLKKKEL